MTYGAWQASRIGGGGCCHGVVFCPSNPNRVYAYSDGGGIYRSDDGGHVWRMIHGGFPPLPGVREVRGVLADPRNADVLLAAAGSEWGPEIGLLRSEDGGGSWALVAPMRFCGNGPRRSDGVVLARNPHAPDEVFAAGVGTGLRRSMDGGRTWRQLGLEGLFPSDLKIDRRNPKRMWLCAHPERTQLGAFAGGFHRSEDGGASWRPLEGDVPDQVLQDPVDDSALVGVFGWSRLRRSRDGGETWEEFSQGLPDTGDALTNYTSEGRFQALAAGPDFLLTASTRGTVWRRGYRAAEWERVRGAIVDEGPWWGAFRGRPGEWRRFGAGTSCLVVDPGDPRHWIFTDWFALWHSTDAGAHWRIAVEGMEGLSVHCLARTPGVVHLGVADSGYFRSEDNGTSFRHVGFPGGGSHIRNFAVSAAKPGRVYAVGSRGYEWESSQPWRSDDAGRTWARVDGFGLPGMEDAGACSIAAAPDAADYLLLAVSGPVESGVGGVYHSADGGGHWVWASEGLPGGAECFRRHVYDMGGSELVIGPGGLAVAVSLRYGHVFRRPGAGRPWEPAGGGWPAGKFPVSVAAGATGAFFLAVFGDGIWRSTDGGGAWSRVRAGNAATVAVDCERPVRVAAGMEDGLVVSQDDGTTWRHVDESFPNRHRPVPGFASGRLLAGTHGNGVFWMPLEARAA
ncbi:MAG: hypothetical protein AAB152_14880 [Candidatus Coatesbacteria bacterium]